VSRGRGRSSAEAETIHVGVLRIVLTVPGAHSLKDRRQAVLSVRDRIRHRFEVTFNEIGAGEDPQRQTVVITTAGNDGRKIRSVLDACAGLVHEHPVVVAAEVDVDVFRWQASGEDWAARMTAELVRPEGSDE
jgi:uncharacterized protein YlxP (DUF503 family)